MEAEVTSVLGGDAVGQVSSTWELATHVVRHRRFGVEQVALLGDVVAKVEVASKDVTGSVSLPVKVDVDPRCQAQMTPAFVIVKW